MSAVEGIEGVKIVEVVGGVEAVEAVEVVINSDHSDHNDTYENVAQTITINVEADVTDVDSDHGDPGDHNDVCENVVQTVTNNDEAPATSNQSGNRDDNDTNEGIAQTNSISGDPADNLQNSDGAAKPDSNPVKKERKYKGKCASCGLRREACPSVRRFPVAHNTYRAVAWAKFAYPNKQEEWTLQKLERLHNSHGKFLCDKHFADDSFSDSARKKWKNTCIPTIYINMRPPSLSEQILTLSQNLQNKFIELNPVKLPEIPMDHTYCTVSSDVPIVEDLPDPNLTIKPLRKLTANEIAILNQTQLNVEKIVPACTDKSVFRKESTAAKDVVPTNVTNVTNVCTSANEGSFDISTPLFTTNDNSVRVSRGYTIIRKPKRVESAENLIKLPELPELPALTELPDKTYFRNSIEEMISLVKKNFEEQVNSIQANYKSRMQKLVEEHKIAMDRKAKTIIQYRSRFSYQAKKLRRHAAQIESLKKELKKNKKPKRHELPQLDRTTAIENSISILTKQNARFCRACLGTCDLKAMRVKKKVRDLRPLFEAATSVQIPSGELAFLCDSCISTSEYMCKFKDQCIEVDQNLYKHLMEPDPIYNEMIIQVQHSNDGDEGNVELNFVPINNENLKNSNETKSVLNDVINQWKNKPKKGKTLTIIRKYQLIQDFDKKVASRRNLAVKYGITYATLVKILNSRKKIEDAVKLNGEILEQTNLMRFPRLHASQYREIESILYEFYSHDIENTTSVMWMKKARSLAEEMNLPTFVPDHKWLNRFKKRYNIVTMQNNTAKAASDLMKVVF